MILSVFFSVFHLFNVRSKMSSRALIARGVSSNKTWAIVFRPEQLLLGAGAANHEFPFWRRLLFRSDHHPWVLTLIGVSCFLLLCRFKLISKDFSRCLISEYTEWVAVFGVIVHREKLFLRVFIFHWAFARRDINFSVVRLLWEMLEVLGRIVFMMIGLLSFPTFTDLMSLTNFR